MGRARLTIGPALAAALLASAGCGAGSGEGSNESPVVDPVVWAPCDDEALDGGDCATIAVPLDHIDLDGPTIDIALYRVRARGERRVTWVVNPGGPGASGVEYARDWGRAGLPDGVELVGFDPRGVGRSHPVSCFTREQTGARLDTGTVAIGDAELQAWLDEASADAARCAAVDLAPTIGTTNVARDLDRIRVALDEDQLTYIGFSYGARLGWTYAALYPERVRAMVLDGPEDPDAGYLDAALQQATTFETLLAEFSAECTTHPLWHCPADPSTAVADVLARANTEPLGTRPSQPLLSGTYALNAVLSAFYDESSWEDLGEALAGALDGDGLGLLQLSFAWRQRQDAEYIDSTGVQSMIACADRSERPTLEEHAAIAEAAAQASPALAPAYPGSVPYCWGVPPATEPTPAPVGPTSTPIVVVGTTGDISTPYQGAVDLTEALGNAVLLTAEGRHHTAYFANTCVRDLVDAYLTRLEVPAAGTVCSPDAEPPG